jgi:membrane associated rhomboid family serine protease
MWFLWVFGDNVEAHLGKIKYLALYLITGIAGNLLQYVFVSDSTIPMLGASGAVSGILGSYVIFFPGSRIKSILILFFYITVTEIPAIIYIFYWFAIQVLSGFASLPVAQQTGGVAFWAHVGGFISGLVLARRLNQRDKHSGVIDGELIE